MTESVLIHPTAEVSPRATIGEGTRIWHVAQVREDARIGRSCILGHGAYVDVGVVVGDRVKLENNVSVFQGAVLENGVFVGPHSALLNDRRPRALTPQGAVKGPGDWEVCGVRLREGSSIGGGCTVLPGITVGCFAMVGAGSVVTHDVPSHGLVVGNPARLVGKVCVCGSRVQGDRCLSCGEALPAR